LVLPDNGRIIARKKRIMHPDVSDHHRIETGQPEISQEQEIYAKSLLQLND